MACPLFDLMTSEIYNCQHPWQMLFHAGRDQYNGCRQVLHGARTALVDLVDGKAWWRTFYIITSLGPHTTAIRYLEQGRAIAEKMDIQVSHGLACGTLGSIYALICEYCRAVKLYEQALSIYVEVGYLKGAGDFMHHPQSKQWSSRGASLTAFLFCFKAGWPQLGMVRLDADSLLNQLYAAFHHIHFCAKEPIFWL